MSSYLELPVLEVKQPFWVFYITKIKARDLLKVSYSKNLDDNHTLIQRKLDTGRLKTIQKYIQTVECAFPNSIILAANYSQDDWFLVPNEDIHWKIEKKQDWSLVLLVPTSEKIVSIVDWQHRLFWFQDVEDKYKDIELLCSVYLDLPKPYQAYLFATINFNQVKVNKNLAYELFWYSLESSSKISRTPEQLAVYLTRKLNFSNIIEKNIIKSPFLWHISLVTTSNSVNDNEWNVSTSTMVDWILKLFSKKPKDDKYNMETSFLKTRKRDLLKDDRTPLRKFYLELKDEYIYNVIVTYFDVIINRVFQNNFKDIALSKKIWFQALFDVLYEILDNSQDIDYSEQFFLEKLKSLKNTNFTGDFFLPTSEIGRTRIKDVILLLLWYKQISEIKNKDIEKYKQYIKS